jgi:hypothetical protein
MMTRATAALGLAISSSALVAFAAAAPDTGASTPAGASKVYRDAAGDAKGGPDFKSLTISDTGGVIKLVLYVGLKTPAPGEPTPFAETFFDTNGDGSAEYMFSVDESRTSTHWCLVSAAARSKCIASRTLQFNASGNRYTLRMASADLAGAAGFDFWVRTGTFTTTGEATAADDSPTNWLYALRSVKLLLGTPLLAPATPVAGQRFTISVPVSRSDGAQLPGDKGTRGSAKLPMLNGVTVVPDDLGMQFENDRISVSFTLPADAAGKQLELSVSAMSGRLGLGMPGISTFALNASRSFSFSFTVAPPQH